MLKIFKFMVTKLTISYFMIAFLFLISSLLIAGQSDDSFLFLEAIDSKKPQVRIVTNATNEVPTWLLGTKIIKDGKMIIIDDQKYARKELEALGLHIYETNEFNNKIPKEVSKSMNEDELGEYIKTFWTYSVANVNNNGDETQLYYSVNKPIDGAFLLHTMDKCINTYGGNATPIICRKLGAYIKLEFTSSKGGFFSPSYVYCDCKWRDLGVPRRKKDKDGYFYHPIYVYNQSVPGKYNYLTALELIDQVYMEKCYELGRTRLALLALGSQDAPTIWSDARQHNVELMSQMVSSIATAYLSALSFAPGGNFGFVVDDLSEGRYLSASLALLPYFGRGVGKAVSIKTSNATINFASNQTQSILRLKRMLETNSADFTNTLLKTLSTCNDVQKGLILRAVLCFPAGTLVATKDGLRQIESLKKGDLVVALDEATGRAAYKPIINTTVNTASSLVSITLENGEIIRATPDHPIYANIDTETNWKWVEASDITTGSLLYSATHGMMRVVSTEHIYNSALVYSIQVEQFPTYFVGESCILVHNADCNFSRLSVILNKIKKNNGNSVTILDILKANYHDHARHLTQALAVQLGNTKGGNQILYDAFRRLGGGGYHEIIPCANIPKIIAVADTTERIKLVNMMHKMRIPTKDLILTSKKGESFTPFGWNHVSVEFHNASNAAFKKALEKGTFNKKTFKDEMMAKVLPFVHGKSKQAFEAAIDEGLNFYKLLAEDLL